MNQIEKQTSGESIKRKFVKATAMFASYVAAFALGKILFATLAQLLR